MLWKKRVKFAKRFFVQISLIKASVLQLCMQAQLGSVFIKAFFQLRATCLGFGEQAGIADLLDVAGFKVDFDGETILKLEQFPEFICARGSSSVNVCCAVAISQLSLGRCF